MIVLDHFVINFCTIITSYY